MMKTRRNWISDNYNNDDDMHFTKAGFPQKWDWIQVLQTEKEWEREKERERKKESKHQVVAFENGTCFIWHLAIKKIIIHNFSFSLRIKLIKVNCCSLETYIV